MQSTFSVILLTIYYSQSCYFIPPKDPPPKIYDLQLLTNDIHSVLLTAGSHYGDAKYCKKMDSTNGKVTNVQCSDYKNKIRNWSSPDIDPTNTFVSQLYFDDVNNTVLISIDIERNGETLWIEDALAISTHLNDTTYKSYNIEHKSFTLNSLFTTFITLKIENDNWRDTYYQAIAIKFNDLYNNEYKILSGNFQMIYKSYSGSVYDSWYKFDMSNQDFEIEAYESVKSLKLPLTGCVGCCVFASDYLVSFDVNINEITNEYNFTATFIDYAMNVDTESALGYSWSDKAKVFVYDLNNGSMQWFVPDLTEPEPTKTPTSDPSTPSTLPTAAPTSDPIIDPTPTPTYSPSFPPTNSPSTSPTNYMMFPASNNSSSSPYWKKIVIILIIALCIFAIFAIILIVIICKKQSKLSQNNEHIEMQHVAHQQPKYSHVVTQSVLNDNIVNKMNDNDELYGPLPPEHDENVQENDSDEIYQVCEQKEKEGQTRNVQRDSDDDYKWIENTLKNIDRKDWKMYLENFKKHKINDKRLKFIVNNKEVWNELIPEIGVRFEFKALWEEK